MTRFEFETALENLGYLRKGLENTEWFAHRTLFISNLHKDLPNLLVEESKDYENPYYEFDIRIQFDNGILVTSYKFSDVIGYLHIMCLVTRDVTIKYTLKEVQK